MNKILMFLIIVITILVIIMGWFFYKIKKTMGDFC